MRSALGKVNVHEFLRVGREVDGGTAVGDFDLAPGPMHIEQDEQTGATSSSVQGAASRLPATKRRLVR
jgi:hypothetical protein